MGLGTTFARQNIINQYRNQTPFWDNPTGEHYSELNNVIVPKFPEIQAFQLQQLKRVETAILDNKFTEMNNLIGKTNLSNIVSLFASEENKQLSEVTTNFVKRANALLWYKNRNGYSETEWKSIQTRLLNLKTSLMQLIAQTSMDQPIAASYIAAVDDALKACGIRDAASLRDFTIQINQFKGAAVEDAGVAWLNAHKIPNTVTIRLGNVSLRTKDANRHSGQLIQDLMTISLDTPDILDTIIEYQPIGSNEFIQAPLRDFIDALNKASGQEKQIVLNDNGYSALLNLSQLSFQAKSGLKQKLWNMAKYNTISISEFGKDDNLAISVRRTFELLHSLDLEQPKDIWVKDESADYNALANYGLGTVLAKVMSLSATEGNQYVLTPAGFTTFSERLTWLFKTQKQIAQIQGNVRIDNSTLTNAYSVEIGSE